MTITLNGSARDLAVGTTVAGLIESVTGTTRGSAVVVDGEVLPRAQWATYELRPGQSVELITAVQGG